MPEPQTSDMRHIR